MSAEFKPGDLIFLTKSYNDYVHEKHPYTKAIFTNKIGKIEDIIDWNTSKGKLLKKAREESGKWVNLPLEENKYIISIYHHELSGRKGQKGVAERGVCMFSNHPETKEPFFEKIPDWIYKEILKRCESFSIEVK